MKAKVKSTPARRLWKSIHVRFSNKPRLPPRVNGDVITSESYDSFTPDSLSAALAADFNQLRYVDGVFYEYATSGIWREVSEDRIGRRATERLGSSARTARIKDALQLLKYKCQVNLNNFAPQPGYINLKNGMLELCTRKLLPHGPEYHSRCQLPYAYEPTAKCSRFLKFLAEIFEKTPDQIITVQQWFGYCLTIETFLQLLVFLLGIGSNGKGVLLRLLDQLVGADNACHIPLERLAKDFVLAELKDKLINTCGEVDTSQPLPSSILKTLTGEDPITIDVKYKTAITFKPIAKHTFAVNELPTFRDKTHALRRRVIFLSFTRIFDEGSRDTELDAKLQAELPGILNWALAGLDSVLENRTIYEPDASKEIVRRFSEKMNPVLGFVRNMCDLSANDLKMERKDVYAAYRKWHHSNIGDHELSKITFYECLKNDFPTVRAVRNKGIDYFRGLKLKDQNSK
jgi:putative DNA primase/helicase